MFLMVSYKLLLTGSGENVIFLDVKPQADVPACRAAIDEVKITRKGNNGEQTVITFTFTDRLAGVCDGDWGDLPKKPVFQEISLTLFNAAEYEWRLKFEEGEEEALARELHKILHFPTNAAFMAR